MSELASSIAERKRLIIKNPDGSFLYCNKAGEKDIVVNVKNSSPHNNNQQPFNMFPDNFTISDEELQYIIENYDQNENANLLEQVLSVFRKNQFFFCFLFILEMFLSCLLLMITWKRKEYSILIMQNLYKDINNSQAQILFHGIFFLNLSINFLLYPLGCFSLMTKKIQITKYFSTLCLYSALAAIFIVYLNVLFIFIFIFRLILFGYSRLILNLLVSILMLHRSIYSGLNRNNQNNSNEYNSI